MIRLILKKDGGKIILNKKPVKIENTPIKKKRKKRKKKKSSNDDLDTQYLDYDLNIESEFKKTLISNFSHKLDMNIINKLPKLESDKIIEIKVIKKKKLKIKLKKIKPLVESMDIEIDVDSLDKQLIGNEVYYIDYDKGIIYDKKLNSVGNIGEFGEINI
jgi:hypothetical protein